MKVKAGIKTYTDAKGKGEPTLRAEEAYAVLAEKKWITIHGMFAKTTDQTGLDLSSYETQAHRLDNSSSQLCAEFERWQKRFLDLVLTVNKAISLCGTLDEAKTLHKEIAFYSAIKGHDQ